MKKKATVILLAILMLVPGIVGLLSYQFVKNSPISQKSVSRMELTDLKGTQYIFERSSAELDITDLSTNPLRFFMQLNSNASEVTALPEPLLGSEFYKAVFTSYGRQVNYKYYLTGSPEYCYYTDDTGRAYKISEEYASALLRSEYAMSLFDNAKVPTMTLSAGEVVEPASIKWNYAVSEGVYSTYTHTADEIDATSHSISGGIEMNFDIQPDTLAVKVVYDGAEIFNGLYADLGSVDIAVGSNISVTADAAWVETADRGYSGEATYTFNAVYLDKPLFYVGETSVEVGDFVVLTAKNVTDNKTLGFSSEPAINYTPIFFRDGAFYRALIPISIYAEHPATYTFTCTADGVSQDVILNVSPRKQKVTSTAEDMGDFKTQLAEVYATQTSTRYFNSIFTDPFTAEKTARVGFYNKRPGAGGTDVLHEGYDYPASNGETICAVNNGVVLFAGEVSKCGSIVVVDHGFGLMTTYVYLSGVTVQAGDEVKTGSKLGTAGVSDHVHLEVTVFGNPVDIDTLWKHGVITND